MRIENKPLLFHHGARETQALDAVAWVSEEYVDHMKHLCVFVYVCVGDLNETTVCITPLEFEILQRTFVVAHIQSIVLAISTSL